jgi:hypothetical protein
VYVVVEQVAGDEGGVFLYGPFPSYLRAEAWRDADPERADLRIREVFEPGGDVVPAPRKRP